VILLDTHIWVWWVQGDQRLKTHHAHLLEQHESAGLAVSAISCWEVSMLAAKGRIRLPVTVVDWLQKALAYPGLSLLPLSPEIAAESCELPGEFHHDPADQIIVATARHFDIPLVTVDGKITSYPHVRLA
jgi:PIN domain nuclease of toxin-antitoxin system